MTLVSTNAVIVQGGSGNTGDLIYASNPSELEIAAGDKVLANYIEMETDAKQVWNYNSSLTTYDFSQIIPLPNNDFLGNQRYYSYNPDTNKWTSSTNSFTAYNKEFTLYRQGNVVIGRLGYYYDFSLGTNGYLGSFSTYFLKVNTSDYFQNNGGYAIKAGSNTAYIYLYPWGGTYSNDDITTDTSYLIYSGGSFSDIQWLNVINKKIFIGLSSKTYIIDTTNFPACTKTEITHSSGGVAIGCTGDNDGDYDIKYHSTYELSIKRKIDGEWVESSLPFLDYRMHQYPTYEPNSKILTVPDALNDVFHVYEFNTTSKEFEEIALPEDIAKMQIDDEDLYMRVGTDTFRPISIITNTNNIRIGYTGKTKTTSSNKKYNILKMVKNVDGAWIVENNSSARYYPNSSVTGVATGNVDDEGRIEISTVL